MHPPCHLYDELCGLSLRGEQIISRLIQMANAKPDMQLLQNKQTFLKIVRKWMELMIYCGYFWERATQTACR